MESNRRILVLDQVEQGPLESFRSKSPERIDRRETKLEIPRGEKRGEERRYPGSARSSEQGGYARSLGG
jgi:hypothetical protein